MPRHAEPNTRADCKATLGPHVHSLLQRCNSIALHQTCNSFITQQLHPLVRSTAAASASKSTTSCCRCRSRRVTIICLITSLLLIGRFRPCYASCCSWWFPTFPASLPACAEYPLLAALARCYASCRNTQATHLSCCATHSDLPLTRSQHCLLTPAYAFCRLSLICSRLLTLSAGSAAAAGGPPAHSPPVPSAAVGITVAET
jgi:hypothetical protein